MELMTLREGTILCLEPRSPPHNAADMQERIKTLDRKAYSLNSKKLSTNSESLSRDYQAALNECYEEKRNLNNALKELKVW